MSHPSSTYLATEVVYPGYTSPLSAAPSSPRSINNNKTYLKYKARFTKFRKSAIIKLRIINKANSKTKSFSSSSTTRGKSSSNGTIFVGNISKNEDESFCSDKIPDYTITTSECSPRLSLDELQDSLVENKSNDSDEEEEEVKSSCHSSIVEEKCQQVVVDNNDSTAAECQLPSSPPPQYKAVTSPPTDQLDTVSSPTSASTLASSPASTHGQPHPHTPVKPTQIKFKSQLNQYLASFEEQKQSQPQPQQLEQQKEQVQTTSPSSLYTEPYTSLKQYNKTTNQQYSQYQLINPQKHKCINYYWLYLDLRQNHQLVTSLHVGWYSWTSGLITFMIIYALFVCLC
ncbi:hypothetical protein CANMA_003657 [Candida margitis]|uniref:uncharacterized protein n=1 Tax=Candida margitis TaxID=1775924 RepID=UPI0022266E67|nr:uncharacterized protein CANMA_003657 [Candida margitis]KAI5962882.1 hypothetical protein CANMA_003657 [Candida margitis]